MKNELVSFLNLVRGRQVAIYGMGTSGSILYDELKDIKGIICLDNNKAQYASGEWIRYHKCYVFVTPLYDYKDIEDELIQYGYTEWMDYVCVSKIHKIRTDIESRIRLSGFCLRGEYETFESARDALCTLFPDFRKGYEEYSIVDSVNGAIQEVRKGYAEYERDGVLFYKRSFLYNVNIQDMVVPQERGVQI